MDWMEPRREPATDPRRDPKEFRRDAEAILAFSSSAMELRRLAGAEPVSRWQCGPALSSSHSGLSPHLPQPIRGEHWGHVTSSPPITAHLAAQPVVAALQQAGLVAPAREAADQPRQVAAAEHVGVERGGRVSEAELAAGDRGLAQPPAVPAGGAPGPPVHAELEPALGGGAAPGQPHLQPGRGLHHGQLGRVGGGGGGGGGGGPRLAPHTSSLRPVTVVHTPALEPGQGSRV